VIVKGERDYIFFFPVFKTPFSTGREGHSGGRGGKEGHAAHNREMKTRVFLFLMFLHAFFGGSGGMITNNEHPLYISPR
jgi:hypothetical protein